MFQLIANPTVQKSLASGLVGLLKVGTLTVASVYLSRATHETGKNFIVELTQNYRAIRHGVS